MLFRPSELYHPRNLRFVIPNLADEGGQKRYLT